MTNVDALLQELSRTIALAIPLLPEPTRTEVSVASLLFRVIGTFETTTQRSFVGRLEALTQFNELLDIPPEAANEVVRESARDPPSGRTPDTRSFWRKCPRNVLRAFQHLRERRSHLNSATHRQERGRHGDIDLSIGMDRPIPSSARSTTFAAIATSSAASPARC